MIYCGVEVSIVMVSVFMMFRVPHIMIDFSHAVFPVKTTGISESFLQVGELRYRLLDVGGQRTERRKWLNCFGERALSKFTLVCFYGC